MVERKRKNGIREIDENLEQKKQYPLYTDITQEEFNKHLELTDHFNTYECKYNLLESKHYMNNHSPLSRYIVHNGDWVFLTYKFPLKDWVNVRTNIAKDYNKYGCAIDVSPRIAASQFSKYVNVHDFRAEGCPINNIGAFSDAKLTRSKWENYYGFAVCYDVNKSFFAACNNLMPKQEICKKYAKPKENQVGFNLSGIPILGPSNNECIYVFDLEYNQGLNRWIKKLTSELNEASKLSEKEAKNQKAAIKLKINEAIGCLANKNPFLRNMIVHYSNQNILQYYNKYQDKIIYSNADSLVCTEHIEELDALVGPEIGQFKIEHEGMVFSTGNGLQWYDHDSRYKCSNVSEHRQYLYKEIFGKEFNIRDFKNIDDALQILSKCARYELTYEEPKEEVNVNDLGYYVPYHSYGYHKRLKKVNIKEIENTYKNFNNQQGENK